MIAAAARSALRKVVPAANAGAPRSALRKCVPGATAVVRHQSGVSPHAFYILNSFGPDRVGIVSELAKVVLDNGGNIKESRMVRMGGSFTVIMRLGLRKELHVDLTNKFKSVKGVEVSLRETEPEKFAVTSAPKYIAAFELAGADNPGLVYAVTDFFARRAIRIEKLSSETRGAPFGGTTLFVMKGMVVSETALDAEKLHKDFKALELSLGVDLKLTEVQDPLVSH